VVCEGRPPPPLAFDERALSVVIGPRDMTEYRRLDCFTRIPGRGQHFLLTNARNVEGFDGTAVQMFQVENETPKLVESPPFTSSRKEMGFRKPQPPIEIPAPREWRRPTEPRRITSARRPETGKVTSQFPWLLDEALKGKELKRSQTPVRIVNPAERKQSYRHLVAVFGHVQRR
jgi:hypothetical protein